MPRPPTELLAEACAAADAGDLRRAEALTSELAQASPDSTEANVLNELVRERSADSSSHLAAFVRAWKSAGRPSHFALLPAEDGPLERDLSRLAQGEAPVETLEMVEGGLSADGVPGISGRILQAREHGAADALAAHVIRESFSARTVAEKLIAVADLESRWPKRAAFERSTERRRELRRSLADELADPQLGVGALLDGTERDVPLSDDSRA